MDGGTGTARDWFAVPDAAAGKQAASTYYLRWPLVSVLELDLSEQASTCARHHLRGVLPAWRVPRGVAVEAELICSELVTNAIQATGTLPEPAPVGLRLLANAQRLVLEAWDCHPGVPLRRPPSEVASAEATNGRGLAIVAELSNRWGTRRLSARVKSVWAELLLPGLPFPAVPLPARPAHQQSSN
jgi:anti-sigma regulatory factor (Ser/Thr protein kinase)